MVVRRLIVWTVACVLVAWGSWCPARAAAPPGPDAEGFVPLFNGKDLTGWVGATRGYVPDNDGNLVCLHGGNLYTAKEYGDFIFRFEFKLTPGANNGLGIRAPLRGNAAYVGMELQILDNSAPRWARLRPYQYHGSIYGVVPAKRGFLKPVGEWNAQEVIAKGQQITVKLNGTVIVDADLGEVIRSGKTPDGRGVKGHPGLLRKKGHIGFLGHGSKLWFRSIRIKELRPADVPAPDVQLHLPRPAGFAAARAAWLTRRTAPR